MTERTESKNNIIGYRLIFRPTDKQYKRLQKIFNKGYWKTLSECLRNCLEVGLNDLEKKY